MLVMVAFSTVADIEGAYHLKYEMLTSWPEEQLVQHHKPDSGCSDGISECPMECTMGCDGLEPDFCYNYLQYSYAVRSYCLGYVSKFSSFMFGDGMLIMHISLIF